YRTDDAAGAAVFTDKTTPQNINYCTGQCWYDNAVHSPAGFPDVVYLLGSFDYSQLQGPSNARGVLLSTDGGTTWSDMTQDGDPHHAEFTHPDQHAIVTNPSDPYQYWEGSDGGVVRSDGNFADVSYKCDQRGLSAAAVAYCKSLLSRVPNQLSSLNEGFSTLQFQSLSVSSKRPQNNLQGGTQDNGTFQYTGSPNVWYQEMYGDGGQSGFSSADDGLRFNTFTFQANDVNFRNGDPTKWVVATGPIVSSPEGSFFYPPVTADPNPSKGGTIFQGSFSVWRTQDWGGNRDFLEANCQEFTTSSANPACGDFVRIGAPGLTDLGSPAYGDRAGSAVAVIERRAADTGTLWAATGTGRVFISANGNAPAGSVVWTRLDNKAANDPNRFPTSITIDPANGNHAWISYSGYNVNTPAQPGHVFEILWNGTTATWTDRSYNLSDLPITDLVRDDVTGDLYAASDFGVMRLANASTTWTVAGTGLPNVEVPGLTIIPSARLLYAATHGRSAWRLQLP
ncbi:MAG: exo-alpha-sialidase, partial [Thermoanaerobaculia bacterium]